MLSTHEPLPLARAGQRLEIGRKRWRDAITGLDDKGLARFCQDLAADPRGAVLLDAVFANSPFLTDCLLAELALLRDLLTLGPEVAFSHILQRVRDLQLEPDRQKLMAALRIARRQTALLAALCDLSGYWPLERITGCLSAFSDAALASALCHLLRIAADKGELRLDDPDLPQENCGLIILGMGKYGARELNFSSDIDLIVLYDPMLVNYTGKRTVQQALIRMTQDLVAIIDQRTADGYVNRVDLRLRPESSATPPAVALPAALSYYRQRGQDWERAALIKARPVAGDLGLGRRFLQAVESFVWREELDFWALRAIRAIKRQIDTHRGGPQGVVPGRNIKLGRGGIREIEFLAQTLQLVHGGRDPYLRSNATIEALTTLSEAGWIDERVAAELIEAYAFLRELEHRLQMVNDQQTQTLPGDREELEQIAHFMQYPGFDPFQEQLLKHLLCVERHYERIMGERPEISEPSALNLVHGRLDEAGLETLQSMGFTDLKQAEATLNRWASADLAVLKARKNRELLLELAPALFESLSRMPQPDAALAALDGFISALTADGRRMLALLSSERPLLELLTQLAGSAPALGAQLAADPSRFELIAQPPAAEAYDARLIAAECNARVRAAGPGEAAAAAVNWFANQVFSAGVAVLRHRIDLPDLGVRLADAGDTLIGSLIRACRQTADQGVAGTRNGISVVALGRYGGRELSCASPLELLVLYDDSGAAADLQMEQARELIRTFKQAQADESVSVSAQIAIAPFAAAGLGRERLRTLVQQSAGLRLQLVGARALADVNHLKTSIDTLLIEAIGPDPALAELAQAAPALRRTGGEPAATDPQAIDKLLHDVELLGRCLRLAESRRQPQLLTGTTAAALTELARSEAESAEVADRLVAHHRLLAGLLAMLHACAGRTVLTQTPAALALLLAQTAGATDMGELQLRVNEAAAESNRLFETLSAGGS